MGKKNLALWSLFTEVLVPVDDEYSESSKGRRNKLAKCKLCQKTFKLCEGSTSGMRKHLRLSHPNHFSKMGQEEKDFEEQERQLLDATIDEEREHQSQPNSNPLLNRKLAQKRNIALLTTKGQSRITKYGSVKKFGKKSAQQLHIDAELTLHLIATGQSFNVLSNPGWRRWMNVCMPEAHIKAPNTFSRHKLRMVYRNMKADMNKMIEKDLKGVSTVCLTSDGWQASNSKCFLACTLHYVTEKFVYKSMLLECTGYKGSHKGPNIAAVMNEIINSYQALTRPDLTRNCTTDGASNMANATQKSDLIDQQFVCVDHMLNNAIQQAVKESPLVKQAVDATKQLSEQLHRSGVDLAILEEYCRESEVPFRKIMQPCKTRWNSIAKMALSVLKMREAFEAIRLSDETNTASLRKILPSNEHFNILEAINPLLQTIQEYSIIFEVDKPKIQSFLVHIHNLKGKIEDLRKAMLEEEDEDMFSVLDQAAKVEVAEVMKSFIDNFQKRVDKFKADDTYGFAAILNPHYKGVPLFKLGLYDKTVDKMVKEHYSTDEHLINNQSNATNDETDEEDLRKLSVADRENRERQKFIAAKRGQTSRAISDDPPLRREINRYEVMPSARADEDHLQWWERHSTELPLLAEMARNIFCIQVTSSPSERVFSTGGRIVNKLRSGLSQETTMMLVYTQQNMSFAPENIAKWNLHNKVESNDECTTSSSDEDDVQTQEPSISSQSQTPQPLPSTSTTTPHLTRTSTLNSNGKKKGSYTRKINKFFKTVNNCNNNRSSQVVVHPISDSDIDSPDEDRNRGNTTADTILERFDSNEVILSASQSNEGKRKKRKRIINEDDLLD